MKRQPLIDALREITDDLERDVAAESKDVARVAAGFVGSLVELPTLRRETRLRLDALRSRLDALFPSADDANSATSLQRSHALRRAEDAVDS